ncbi:hypothetical protein [Sinomonas sp. ASV322]|uniref:hypothetical protein n=1 Tax=Sinomonas sp. ASV322 TaxID=3041920 RepID=UPI0027DE41AB|nr:hypothetical protein [Sinomonas sp. ASV322]MDQ4503859.1 hypothetical protein [Sinomonas sp. ASV322]
MMYATLWRILPGAPLAKAIQCVLLLLAVVVLLFAWVFPAVAQLVAPQNATVATTPAGPP